MSYSSQFAKFITACDSGLDYVFIDPPWNYPPTRYKSDFWKNLTYIDLFDSINSPSIFIYVTLERIPILLSSFVESTYELKALIPYVRVAKNDTGITSSKHEFKHPLQYIAVFQRPDAVPLSNLAKVAILEEDNDYQKPVIWEDQLFMQFVRSNLTGVYLLPDGGIADTDVSKVTGNVPLNKKELF